MVTPKLSDDKLFKAFQAGEPAAFKKFLQLNFHSWVIYAYALLDNWLHSEEVTLEVFSRIWQAKSNLTGFNNVKAFILLAIDQACKDYLSRIFEEEEMSSFNIPGIKKSKKYYRYDAREKRRWLKANEHCVYWLPLFEKQVFILYYFSKVNLEKIAHLLGRNVGEVHNALKLANCSCQVMQKSLKDFKHDESVPNPLIIIRLKLSEGTASEAETKIWNQWYNQPHIQGKCEITNDEIMSMVKIGLDKPSWDNFLIHSRRKRNIE